MCREFWGARGVTCTLDDCSCKRTSCALRLGLHWAVRSCGGCSACRPACLPACPPPPSVVSITPPPPPPPPLPPRNPTTRAPPITADGPHLSIRIGLRAVRLPFRARDGKRKGRMEWQADGRKEREKGRMRWQARAAGETFHVELCQDGCRT